jgi:hypothetical protein
MQTEEQIMEMTREERLKAAKDPSTPEDVLIKLYNIVSEEDVRMAAISNINIPIWWLEWAKDISLASPSHGQSAICKAIIAALNNRRQLHYKSYIEMQNRVSKLEAIISGLMSTPADKR